MITFCVGWEAEIIRAMTQPRVDDLKEFQGDDQGEGVDPDFGVGNWDIDQAAGRLVLILLDKNPLEEIPLDVIQLKIMVTTIIDVSLLRK